MVLLHILAVEDIQKKTTIEAACLLIFWIYHGYLKYCTQLLLTTITDFLMKLELLNTRHPFSFSAYLLYMLTSLRNILVTCKALVLVHEYDTLRYEYIDTKNSTHRRLGHC